MHETDQMLRFEGGGACPVQYECSHRGHRYYIRYRFGWLIVTRDLGVESEKEMLTQQLSKNEDGCWSDEETNVYLWLISQALIEERLESLNIPPIAEIRRHPHFKKGRYPQYVHTVCREDHPHVELCNRVFSAKELEEWLTPDELVKHNQYQQNAPEKI